MGYISNIRKKVGHDPIFMPAAGCVIVKDNKMLLQRRVDNGKWAVHGGCLELGEDFIEGLKREIKEELNIDLINPEFVNIYSGEDLHFTYPNDDEVYAITAIYIVREYKGKFKIDNKEVSELKWFDIKELPKNIHEPDIKPIMDIKERLK